MKNRKLLLIVSLVLALTMSLGGTLAYLQDTDDAVNVMTLGNVKIEQLELQRKAGIPHKGTLEAGDLEEFEQKQPLYPAYPHNNLSSDYTAEPTEILKWNGYVTANGAGNGLWDEAKLTGALDKFIFVKNTGTSDAYYRTIIAFECPEETAYSQGPDKEFMMNVNGHKLFVWQNLGYVEVEGVRYLVQVATYQAALAAGEISRPSLLQVVMTHNATNDTVAKLGNTYEIIALSQAVQTINMPTDPAAALNIAFGEANLENVATWLNGVAKNNPPAVWNGTADTSWFDASQKEFVLTTAEQLAGVAELAGVVELRNQLAGKTIKLGCDIDLAGIEWKPITMFTPENNFTFDGQNHTIYNMTVTGGADKGLFAGSACKIKNVVIENANMKTAGRSAFIAGNHYGDIENCHVKNSVIEDSFWAVGGISGLYNSGNIKDCSITNVTIKSNGGVGGIVGVINETVGTREVVNCKVINSTINNTGAYGEPYYGGSIVGMVNVSNSTVNITGCTSSATLEGKHIYDVCSPVDDDITLNIK